MTVQWLICPACSTLGSHIGHSDRLQINKPRPNLSFTRPESAYRGTDDVSTSRKPGSSPRAMMPRRPFLVPRGGLRQNDISFLFFQSHLPCIETFSGTRYQYDQIKPVVGLDVQLSFATCVRSLCNSQWASEASVQGLCNLPIACLDLGRYLSF